MKSFINGIVIFLIVMMCCVFSGCNQTREMEDDYTEDDDMFVGTYSPDDYWDYGEDEDAKMSIKFDGESYKIELSLTKFGKISCVGNKDNDCLSYTGKNNVGETFYGNIEYEEDGVVEFELWNEEYLLFEDEDDFLEIYFQKE